MSRSNSGRVGYVLARHPGGAEPWIVDELQAHAAAGVEIELFALYAPPAAPVDASVEHLRTPITYLPDDNLQAHALWDELQMIAALLPGCWSALAEALHEDVRVVYQAALLARLVCVRRISQLHAHAAGTASTIARLAARLADIPFSFTVAAGDLQRVRPDDLRRKLEDAAAVIVSSTATAEQLRTIYGPSADRVERIRIGLDLCELVYQSPAARPPQIVAVGALSRGAGGAELIAACALLRQGQRHFSCALIGAGELEHELRAQIVQLGLEDRVQLLGPRPHPELLDRLRRAAVFVAGGGDDVDDAGDDVPPALLTAMALGTPCVATDGTARAEVLHDGETALIVPPTDPPALATALARLLDDSRLRVRLAEGARELIEAQFDRAHTTMQIRECWDAARRAWAGRNTLLS